MRDKRAEVSDARVKGSAQQVSKSTDLVQHMRSLLALITISGHPACCDGMPTVPLPHVLAPVAQHPATTEWRRRSEEGKEQSACSCIMCRRCGRQEEVRRKRTRVLTIIIVGSRTHRPTLAAAPLDGWQNQGRL